MRSKLQIILMSFIVLFISVCVVLAAADLCVAIHPFGLSTGFTRHYLNSALTAIGLGDHRNESYSYLNVFHTYVTLGQTGDQYLVHFHVATDSFVNQLRGVQASTDYGSVVSGTIFISEAAFPLSNATSQQRIEASILWQTNSRDKTLLKRVVFVGLLGGLKSDTIYHFVCGVRGKAVDDGAEHGGWIMTEEVYALHTLPQDDRELRFVVGGDVDNGTPGHLCSKFALSTDPMFVVLGGDITYANNLPACYARWDAWLWWWRDEMRREKSSNALMPLVLAPGNHEAGVRWFMMGGDRDSYYTRYFTFTSQELPFNRTIADGTDGASTQDLQPLSYHFHRVGCCLTILALDSGIFASMDGEQLAWLRQVLADHSKIGIPVLPVYHAPAYPSRRSWLRSPSTNVRENFVRAFEDHNDIIRVAFEHHDHHYKRTFALLDASVDTTGEGIVYVGDGNWGVSGYEHVHKHNHWYLAKESNKNHVLVLRYKNATKRLSVQADGPDGLVDQFNVLWHKLNQR